MKKQMSWWEFALWLFFICYILAYIFIGTMNFRKCILGIYDHCDASCKKREVENRSKKEEGIVEHFSILVDENDGK
jgi:hypothetical protein